MHGVVVGIAGGSGSGKTTLAKAVTQLTPHPTCSLAFDSYYREQNHLSRTEREAINYDHPNSLDVERFVADLATLKSGFPLAAPVYDFAQHTRSADIELIEPMPVIVVDGILLFVFPEICELVDVSVFVDVPDAVRTSRRLERDVAERGRTHEFAMSQIERTVRPMYGEFVQPSIDQADLIIDGTADWMLGAQLVVEALAAQPVLAIANS